MAAYSSSNNKSDQGDSLRPYVESIDLYKKYVADTLAPRLLDWLYDYWTQTQEKLAKERYMEGPFADLVAYQEALQRITDWDDERVAAFMKGLFGEDHVNDAKNKLRTALSRIVAANTALLAAAAPRETQQNLTVQTPAPSFFVHETLIAAAAYLYRHPELVKRADDDSLMALLERTIESEVRKLTPYDTILTEDVIAAAAAAPAPASVDANTAPASADTHAGPAEIAVHGVDADPEAEAKTHTGDGDHPTEPESPDAAAAVPDSADDDTSSDEDEPDQPAPLPPPPRSSKPSSSKSSSSRRYARQAQ